VIKQNDSKTLKNSSLELVARIPKGRVTTYKEIAAALGLKAYRAVGSAIGKNERAPTIPCHRVVNSNGTVGGYAFGIEQKISLLASEGIKIKNGKIEDFKKKMFKLSLVTEQVTKPGGCKPS
jgi:methylated-DNA-[protein]-cysteine S-methyltransferase